MATVAEQLADFRMRKALAATPARATVSPGMNPEMTARISEMTAANMPPDRGVVGGLQLGAQAVGAGAAGLAGLPVDIMETILNAGSAAGELGLGLFGADVDLPEFSGSVGGSQSIKDTAGDAATAVLGEGAVIDRNEMTPSERIRYDAQRLAAESLLTGGAIVKGADKLGSLAAPYTAPGSTTRVLAGDTAAGAGSGVAMSAYDEYVPEEAQGPVGRVIAGLLGGIGGATGARGVEFGVDAASGVGGRLPYTDYPLIDPTTNKPYLRRDVANAAQMSRDEAGSAERFDQNKAAITDYLANKGPDGAFGPGPDPTTALITNDPAALTRERRMRAEDPAMFIEADRAVMSGVSDRVQSVRPENADPAIPTIEAERIARERRAAAEGRVVSAQTDVDQQDALVRSLADPLLARTMMQDQASRDLDRVLVDETYLPARADKNRLYDDAANDPNVVVGTENVRSRATAARDEIDRSNPALRDGGSRRIADAFTAPVDEAATGTTLPAVDVPPGAPRVVRPLGDVMRDRRDLSRVEQEARARGDFGAADTARNVRSGINEDVRAAAESGVPGTEKLAAADSNYREKFAPFFREGTVAPDFFKRVDTDPKRGSTPPEATASKFLIAGPNSAAAARDVRQIIEIAPNPEAGKAAVREYAIADAVSKGVVRDGMVSETQLASYMNARTGMFEQFPELRAEFDAMLSAVRGGKAELGRLSDELTAALENSKLTERQINEGALALAMDTTPENMVRNILGNRNPPARMRELLAEVGGPDTPAGQGLKAAVTDYFVRRVSTASKAGVADRADDTISLPKLRSTFEDNRAALAELYSPEEMQVLNQVQARLELMSRRQTQASAGSATAENRNLRQDISQAVGNVTTLMYGALLGGSYERRTRLVLDQFPDANAAAVRIMKQMTVDPALAKHIMSIPTSDAQMYDWNATLNRLLVVTDTQEETPPRQPMRLELNDPGNASRNAEVP
jgi:hypothetical protein